MEKQFLYLSPEDEKLFAVNGLADFESLWQVRISLVDEPNRNGEGWSEVGVLKLSDGRSPSRRFYLKRQSNYHCRRLENPFEKIPEAVREWLNIKVLDRAGIETMHVSCCARDCRSGEDRAVFATRALDSYRELGEWWGDDKPTEDKLLVLQTIGQLVARLHNAGFNHGCLYPKHVYISDTDAADIRFIDLEKSKRIFGRRGALRDLDSLLRRSRFWSDQDKNMLLAAYRQSSLTRWTEQSLNKALLGRIEAKVRKA